MMNSKTFALVLLVCFTFCFSGEATLAFQQPEHVGVKRIKFLNYPDCIELSNKTTRVVLGHHIGGRLLAYERNGKNVLYLALEESNYDPQNRDAKPPTSAGRFDMGPEFFQVRGTTLWAGEWTAEILGDRKARMVSAKDPQSGLVVTRTFTLHPDSSRLTFTQSVENQTDKTVKQCFWSRTFAKHGGVAIVPCDSRVSRIPGLYYMSQTRYLINFNPKDPAVRRIDDLLAIDGPGKYSKLGFDSCKGWVAYQTRDDLLFVKRYRVYPFQSYGEAASINLSIWYPKKEQTPACEIEPIGPLVSLKPGDESSFTVDWWLLDRKFPESGVVNPKHVELDVNDFCKMN